MQLQQVVNVIDRQKWLDPIAATVQGAIRSAYRAGGPVGKTIKNFLHGTWLGHPLHSVLTDVPLGAWTTAAVLDTVEAGGQHDLAPGADLAVAIGIAGAAGSALAGLTDWQELRGRRGRVGLVHASFNTLGLLLYVGSLAARRGGQRGLGRSLAYLGYGVVASGAFLGGELVYRLKSGVDHEPEQPGPRDFVAVLADADLAEGQLRRVEAAGAPVLLARRYGRAYALSDVCTHLGCSLAEGKLSDESITCSCHGSRYALADGQVLDGPSTYDQPAFDVRVRDGQIEVRQAREI